MKIIINLGRGSLQQGCSNVVVQLLRNRHYVRQFSGSLPPAPKLAKLHAQWQEGYRSFYREKELRIGLLESEGMRYSEADFKQICRQIPHELNHWLSSEEFAVIERALRTDLQKNEVIQVIITAANQQLQQLPWQLWNFIDDYPLAEISFNSLNWQETKAPVNTRKRVRILAVLGNSTGIEVEGDLEALKILPESEVTVLTEPSLAQLNEYLWQPKGWDILLFSGHSYTDIEAGYIYLNATESITIAQLKHSLSKAIAQGLQIAIFNSCEGIGLAAELADLSLPYTVVMVEPVPDKIARIFLQYFLTAFGAGKTFILSVKEARQKLAGWEAEYACASWLPAIWQNPASKSLTWRDFQPEVQPVKPHLKSKFALISSVVAAGLVMVCRSFGWLEPLELKAYDHLMQQRPAETIDPRILVVEITEEDTNSDRYPLSNQALIKAIDLLEQHEPAAIGLDIHRSNDTGEEYANLIERLENNSHLFPVCAYANTNASYNPPKGLSSVKLRQQMGFSDLLLDGQGISSQNNGSNLILNYNPNPKVRRQLLSYYPSFANTSLKCLTPYSLSFQLSFEYLQKQGIEPMAVTPKEQWQFGSVTLQQLSSRFGGYQQLDGQSSQIAINYRAGKPGKTVSLNQLLTGNIDPEWVRNRIILVGYTSTVAQDYFDTPYGVIPGVWIHAHMTSQIISAVEDGRALIWALPQWVDWLIVVGCSMAVGLVLISLTGKPRYIYLLGGIILILALDRIFLLVLVQGGWLPYIPTILSLLILTCTIVASRKIIFSNQKLLKN